jgi:hypothetical protein
VPKRPEREAYEKSREFKNGQRFGADIEGRISVLFRGRGMKRCLAQGRERFELWVAAAVLASGGQISAVLHCNHRVRQTGALRNRDENRVRIPGECRYPPSVCPSFIGELPRLDKNAGVSRQKLDLD